MSLDFSALNTHTNQSTCEYQREQCRIVNVNSRDLDSWIDNDIHLTVTSPPYSEAIDYDEHIEGGDYSAESGDVVDWKVMMWDVFETLFRHTVDGGYCGIVVGNVSDEQSATVPLPSYCVEVMEDIGWQLHEDIIWNKVTGGSARFGTTVQHPYPGYYYPNQQHEYIQVYRKGSNPRKVRDEESAFEITDVMKREVANSVWHIPPVPHNKYDHPAPFPAELVWRLVTLYSGESDYICDPFAGLMTTPLVARSQNRDCLAVELREEYVERGLERLDCETFERDETIVPEFETHAV